MKELLRLKPPFKLPELPFGESDLEPFMTARTFEFHHKKHHNAYVTKLNELVLGKPLASQSLEEIIMHSYGKPELQGIFNNAAQVYNHSFFWASMKKKGGGEPTGELFDIILQSFGSLDDFKAKFKDAGVTQFGSGWAWLVFNKQFKKLEVLKTPNAETPLINPNTVPILTADVWEHAYYIDYQNRRPDFLDTFLNNLVNWDFASKNLQDAIVDL